MECIFCKIINGTISSAKIWENDSCIAILDIFPNVKGQTLVITKQHFDSDIFDKMPSVAYQNFFNSAHQVINLLKAKLGVKRVALVIEGLGVNHAHIKLYPLHGLDHSFQEMIHPERIYFEKYQGYISTQIGPNADLVELKKLAEFIAQK